MDEILNRRLERIERDQKKILAILTGEKKPKHWVKAGDILKLTGWNREMLRQRRAAGLVEYKHDDKGWFYNPDSIPPQLIGNERSNVRNA